MKNCFFGAFVTLSLLCTTAYAGGPGSCKVLCLQDTALVSVKTCAQPRVVKSAQKAVSSVTESLVQIRFKQTPAPIDTELLLTAPQPLTLDDEKIPVYKGSFSHIASGAQRIFGIAPCAMFDEDGGIDLYNVPDFSAVIPPSPEEDTPDNRDGYLTPAEINPEFFQKDDNDKKTIIEAASGTWHLFAPTQAVVLPTPQTKEKKSFLKKIVLGIKQHYLVLGQWIKSHKPKKHKTSGKNRRQYVIQELTFQQKREQYHAAEAKRRVEELAAQQAEKMAAEKSATAFWKELKSNPLKLAEERALMNSAEQNMLQQQVEAGKISKADMQAKLDELDQEVERVYNQTPSIIEMLEKGLSHPLAVF